MIYKSWSALILAIAILGVIYCGFMLANDFFLILKLNADFNEMNDIDYINEFKLSK